ncbi:MAG: hypothetical protein FJZ16_06660 [Candidatus Omnitrophica bacterium]|nr:hypothetical protein [Candidatus Omnitrophota bacterium]
MAKRIEIVSRPQPTEKWIPENVLQALVGLVTEAEGPVTIPTSWLTNPRLYRSVAEKVYLVPTELFLRKLKEKDEETWKWFSQHTDALIVTIEVEVCKEVQEYCRASFWKESEG